MAMHSGQQSILLVQNVPLLFVVVRHSRAPCETRCRPNADNDTNLTAIKNRRAKIIAIDLYMGIAWRTCNIGCSRIGRLGHNGHKD
jgi:hypothetical protein